MGKVPIISREEDIDIERQYDVPALECPFCHSKVKPELLAALFNMPLLEDSDSIFGSDERVHFYALFPCCNNRHTVSCDAEFTTYDSKILKIRCENWMVDGFTLGSQHTQIPDTVKEISPAFAAIYDEARTAQSFGLSQISGAGYRKALECLLKDYAIALYPDRKDEILRMEMGNCFALLRELVSPTLLTFAERAIWLGNDQVHYVPKWAEKDIKDLEYLISYLLSAIDIKERQKQLLKEMPKKR